MNKLALTGSLRKGGNTDLMLDALSLNRLYEDSYRTTPYQME